MFSAHTPRPVDPTSERGLDLLIGYRVYDPDGDQEEMLPEAHEPDVGGNLGPGSYASPAARREEIEAMAAAAGPGGLARRPPDVPREQIMATAAGEGGGGGGGNGAVGVPNRPDADGSVDGIAAPAAGGWVMTGRAGAQIAGGEEEPGGNGGGEGGGGGGGGRRVRRYFGLSSRDEWISASSSRIEKLNSRAPWKNSWTEEVSSTVSAGGGDVLSVF